MNIYAYKRLCVYAKTLVVVDFVWLLLLVGSVVGLPVYAGSGKSSPTSAPDDGSTAFEAIMPVLHHPRCMNCHSSGDFPRQGDDSHRHTRQIRRGPNGRGINSVKCSTCHQDHNLVGIHMPPGAPDWHLPPPDTPMVWEDLSDQQLCELLKDPERNGYRTVQQIVEHMHTPLVLWGWTPGEGRSPVLMPQSEFFAKVQEWASKGAACPVSSQR